MGLACPALSWMHPPLFTSLPLGLLHTSAFLLPQDTWKWDHCQADPVFPALSFSLCPMQSWSGLSL